MISGFIIGDVANATAVIRALRRSLADFGDQPTVIRSDAHHL